MTRNDGKKTRSDLLVEIRYWRSKFEATEKIHNANNQQRQYELEYYLKHEYEYKQQIEQLKEKQELMKKHISLLNENIGIREEIEKALKSHLLFKDVGLKTMFKDVENLNESIKHYKHLLDD